MCLALCAVPLCVRTMISDPLVFTHLRWCAVCVCARNPSICRYVRMCVCVCVCVYMYTCIYIYIYIYIHITYVDTCCLCVFWLHAWVARSTVHGLDKTNMESLQRYAVH